MNKSWNWKPIIILLFPLVCAAGTPAPDVDNPGASCEELAAQFDVTLSEATGLCEKDADCGSYSAGVGKNCGGATDKASADKLGEITKQFRDAKCPHTVHCGPRTVYGIECRSGHCAEINTMPGPGTSR